MRIGIVGSGMVGRTHPLEVEVALPQERHGDPMALDPYNAPRID